jgi:hypothetical protein
MRIFDFKYFQNFKNFQINSSTIMPQLPWTENMVTTLLNIIILKKAHLSGGCKGVKEIWNDVNNAFFA